MLDLGWTEILVIAIVLIIVVGPRDLPSMLRTAGKTMSSLRKMAGEFRSQFDEALKEAELDDVKKTISDARKLNPARDLREAMNPLRKAGEEIKSDLNKAAKGETVAKKDPAAPEKASEPAPTAASASASASTAKKTASAGASSASTVSTSAGSASSSGGAASNKSGANGAAGKSAGKSAASKPAAARKQPAAAKPADPKKTAATRKTSAAKKPSTPKKTAASAKKAGDA